MDEYLKANQKLWNEWTKEHERSPFYDLEGFKAGRERLKSIEYLHEFDFTLRQKFTTMVQGEDS